jgi:hypothetical protein
MNLVSHVFDMWMGVLHSELGYNVMKKKINNGRY